MRRNNYEIKCDYCGFPTFHLFDIDDGTGCCIDCISGWE